MRWSFTLPWLFAAGKPRKLGTYTFCPVAFALQVHLPQPVWSWLGVWGKLKSCSLFLLFPGPGLRRQADIIWMYGDLGCRFDITKHVIDTLQPCGLEALIMVPQEANHINGDHGVPSSKATSCCCDIPWTFQGCSHYHHVDSQNPKFTFGKAQPGNLPDSKVAKTPTVEIQTMYTYASVCHADYRPYIEVFGRPFSSRFHLETSEMTGLGKSSIEVS